MEYLTQKDAVALKLAKARIRALDHKMRQAILGVIRDHKNKLSVTEIYVKLRIEQSVASQHLGILRRAGFVKTERQGKMIHYSVDKDTIKEFVKKCQDL